jgi:hypothetical protein
MLKSGLELDEEYISNSGAYQVKQEDFRFNILTQILAFILH